MIGCFKILTMRSQKPKERGDLSFLEKLIKNKIPNSKKNKTAKSKKAKY